MVTFDEAVEVVKSLGDGMLLEGLEYIRDCLDNDKHDMLSPTSIMSYHLICQRARPFFAPATPA